MPYSGHSTACCPAWSLANVPATVPRDLSSRNRRERAATVLRHLPMRGQGTSPTATAVGKRSQWTFQNLTAQPFCTLLVRRRRFRGEAGLEAPFCTRSFSGTYRLHFVTRARRKSSAFERGHTRSIADGSADNILIRQEISGRRFSQPSDPSNWHNILAPAKRHNIFALAAKAPGWMAVTQGNEGDMVHAVLAEDRRLAPDVARNS